MRKLTVLFLLLMSLCASSQYDNSSFYFNIVNIDTAQTFSGFEEYQKGFYDWKNVDYKQMIVTEDSISVRFGSEIMLPKNAAEAKGYTFKDGKMYGIAPLNGVYYKEVKDTIYALYYQYDSYFSCKSDDLIVPMESGYLLFINESNGFYTLDHFTINDQVLSIYCFNLFPISIPRVGFWESKKFSYRTKLI